MAGSGSVELLVVGGGINGVGLARDAAGRGLKVLLCEQGDLAQATSSASTKLIHGGLRYLEYGEFRLVREALLERERLLGLAPHIIWPLRFVMPHLHSLRPAWLIRLGLLFYDHLARRRRLPGSEFVRFRNSPLGIPLKPGITKGFIYSDCAVQDARLVVLTARDAVERGAVIRTRTRFLSAERCDGLWRATLKDLASGETREVAARVLVNASGPWVDRVLRERLGMRSAKALRLVKGSHIVVPRLFAGEHAYLLQNPDGRIVFAIPYERDFTLIGTTEEPFEGDPATVAIEPREIDYLCESINRYFARSLNAAQMVWSYSGVRPLYDNAEASVSAVTRDYVFDIDAGDGGPALLSVFGGKITTYRRMAERALEKLAPYLPAMGPAWTGEAPLPGGDLPGGDFDSFLAELQRARPWLPTPLAARYARAYGTRVERLLGAAASLAALGRDFGGGLYQAEVDYLVQDEWARNAEDILWRRSKLGLHMPRAAAEALQHYLEALHPGHVPAAT